MRVHENDAKCRTCGGTLNMIAALNDVVTVECIYCGDVCQLRVNEALIDRVPDFLVGPMAEESEDA